MAKIARITIFTKFYTWKEERYKVKMGFEISANFATFLSSNFVMLSIFAKMKSSVTNVTLFIITDSSKIL